ncbi:phospholipid scramblase 1-like isoform X2 [Apostichopus japonicus]|uniref:phospholipid scramblase 1-like isoform X2 n=1 Tax=Stichopus japonicus TaxID=307972 RepID=UPI003AB572A5
MANTPQFGMTGITAVTSPPGLALPTLQVPGAGLSWMDRPPFGMTGITAVTSPPGLALPTLQVPGAALSWMEKPPAAIGCPPGLEYLSQLDQVLVHQQVDMQEVLTNLETANKYHVKNILGQQIFFAVEELHRGYIQISGKKRGFVMHIMDNMNQEVMKVTREYKWCVGCCCACCAGCCNGEKCASKASVEAPPGCTIGYVVQRPSLCGDHLAILDENHETLLKIRGPGCKCRSIYSDIEFNVLSSDETEHIGKITKQWAGNVQEVYTKADNYGIQFQMNLEVKSKAILIGAVILLDFMFFEEQQINQQTNQRL